MRFRRTRLLIAKAVVFLGRLVMRWGSGVCQMGAWAISQRANVSVDLAIGPRWMEGQEPDWSKAFFATSDADGSLYLVTPQVFRVETMSPESKTLH